MICSDVVAIHVDRHNDRNARESNFTIVCVTDSRWGPQSIFFSLMLAQPTSYTVILTKR